MEKSELLQAIAEVKSQITTLNKKLSFLIKKATDNGLLQYTTDINIDITMMCDLLSVEYNDLIGKSKKRQISDSRAVIAWHLVHTFLHNQNSVARALKKDHTTIIDMLRRHERFTTIDQAYKRKSELVEESYYVNSRMAIS